MAKIVQTQYRENYGAHSWDGTGECPQYWKNKGGSTYVVLGDTSAESCERVIQSASEYSEEYIIHSKDVSDEYVANVDKEAAIDFEPWEDRTYITIAEDGSIVEKRKSAPQASMRAGLKSFTKTWEYASGAARHSGDCGSFKAEYLFKNGMVAHSEEEACKILEHLESRVMA